MITNFHPLSLKIDSNRHFLVLVFFLLVLNSCVTERKTEYIQDSDKDNHAFNDTEFPDYRLKPNDQLYININSLDEAAANIFSNATQQPLSLDPYGTSLLSHSVNKDGYLLLPMIGNIFVKGKTLQEVSLILQDSLNHVLNQPTVTVKLVNRYVSVLGEVRTPGHYPVSQEKLTIFDALGLAGDITDYGNPEKITIIRNDNGQNILANLNLAKSDILASEFYYLKPNDIVYVKTLRRNKFWELRQVPLTLLFSAITTGLLIYEIATGN
jgi:polysaccharide biosynthesis/export protein